MEGDTYVDFFLKVGIDVSDGKIDLWWSLRFTIVARAMMVRRDVAFLATGMYVSL